MSETPAEARWPRHQQGDGGRNAALNALAELSFRKVAPRVMARVGIDISGHQALSVGSMDFSPFQIIVAMSNEVRRTLIEAHAVPKLEIRKMFVDDPIGTDVGKYPECANEIARGLKRLSF